MEFINTFSLWFLVFVSYAVIGWCVEVLHVAYKHKKLTNRGFLIGPICPIYGFGAIIMTLILGHTDNIFEIFIVAILSSAILEYATSYLMERLFHVRWWDYSKNPFNIRGRICLTNLFWFGLLGIIIIKFINPFLFGIFGALPHIMRLALASIVLLTLIADISVSLWLIIQCRVTVGAHNADATDEITANIRNILMDKGKLNRRLAKAFPDMVPKKKTSKRSSRRQS